MVILELFAKSININYKSNLISKATLLTLIFEVISIILPFIIAYRSKGLWLKRDVLYEQPNVKFNGEYLFLATTNNQDKPLIICSTIPHFERKFDLMETCSLLKVREVDKNFDNKVDELHFSLQVNLPKLTQLTSFYIIISLDYKLQMCPLQMQSALIYHTFMPVPVLEYKLMGDVVITQSSPLVCHTRKINSSYNYSVLSTDTEMFNGGEFLNSVLTEYAQRNVSTSLRNIYVSFVPGKVQNFKLEVQIRYPEDKVYYKPGFWQMIKWAWIQYLTIYFLISWFITKIKYYIFSKRLVLFYEDNPLKKKQ